MKNFLKVPEGGRFSNRQLLGIYFPNLAEQMLICLLGIVDTLLASRLSDSATAGVSYVITVDAIIKTFLSGLAAGASVLTAQWIGRKNYGVANQTSRISLLETVCFSLIFSGILSINPSEAICLLVGRPDEVTLQYAVDYFRICVLSYPIYAVNYVCNATYRAQGNTKVPMVCSVLTLAISLAAKYLYVGVLHLGVSAYSLANLTGVALSTLPMIPLLLKKTIPVGFRCKGLPFFNRKILNHSLGLAIPQALENAMFQLGLLFVQRFVVSYGVVQSAANGIGKQLQPFNYLVASCWGTVCLVVIAQYVGAGDEGMARRYLKHIMKLSYLSHAIITLPCLFCCRLLVSAFGGSEETLELTRWLFLLYVYAALPLYTPAWVLPNALRGGGDVNFTLISSITTMFALRVGLAYILGTVCGLGVKGVWIAMVTDWTMRAVVYVLRSKGNKWIHVKTG